MNAVGYWENVASGGTEKGGNLSSSISVGVTHTHGISNTAELGAQITASVEAECSFLGTGVKATMTAQVSARISHTISSSASKTRTTTTTISCPY